ncbi:cation:proton antiporter [Treponema sp.]|uniref:cation:proton antiporter n=1 Tax=Treponema sp. TaxID=166 RepID=UPI00298E2F46|nr:cation:proton antiporter [Treponema sp.]MCR5612916.1 cation:proton antiporter [Treponema sp.]
MNSALPNTEIILHILLSVGIIVIVAKYFGVLAKKIGIPQVAGMIVAGLILRFLPTFKNFGATDANVIYNEANQFISYLSEIGVILIMFSAGLGTNIKSLIKSGVKSTIIATCGVFVPLVFGTIMAMCFWGFSSWGTQEFFKSVFIGTIMTATSVSISVAVLKEYGKIKTDIGQTIISAAIIDDVIGIIVLTIVLGVSSGRGGYLGIIVKTLAFFACAIVAGYVVYRLFRWYDRRHPRSRRIPIYALGVALIFAYAAEKFFGIADITGAYIAGIVFCSLNDASYMESKIDINSYMIFSPIFFASIGLKTDLSGMNLNLLWFSIAFVIVGCLSKIVGCGGVSKLLGFKWHECLEIGEGMMVRGEVALIVASKGLSSGLVDSKYFTSVILLIIVSSMLVPILLKKSFSKDAEPADATTQTAQ